ncbi:MAG TPA: glycosyltransferase [Gemmatimonadaceae bacterium]|nr:glycosyltransferase [Gemmatimonadaceae bacterium]
MGSVDVNILYAVHAYKPAYRVGGPVLSVSAAAEMLVRKGHRVTVFTSNSNLDEDLDVPTDRPIDVEGVEVWYFRRQEPLQKWLPFVPYLSRSIGFLYCPAMRDALSRVVPSVDIVDTQMPFVYPSYAAAHAAFRYNKPLFYHQRGIFNEARLRFRGAKKRLYIAAIERPIMRRATTLIALSDGEQRAFRLLGVATPCEIVPNGVDVPAPLEGASERVEQRFGIPRTAPVVLFLGRLHPIKGAAILLHAFMDAARRVPEAVLVMAGPDESRLISEWQLRLADHDLKNRIVFTGMLTGTDKDDMLARSDLFCLPSVGEGFSMAVLEALANRTAVMLSPGCNFPEVETAGAGRIVASDIPRMVDALVDLLGDRERLKRMGEAGYAFVAKNYSWDAITERLIATYNEGIERFAREKSLLGVPAIDYSSR